MYIHERDDIASGGGIDAKFDKKGRIQEVTTSALVTEITNEIYTSGMNKGKISRIKIGLNVGVEASLFFGIEAGFKTGFIVPSQKN